MSASEVFLLYQVKSKAKMSFQRFVSNPSSVSPVRSGFRFGLPRLPARERRHVLVVDVNGNGREERDGVAKAGLLPRLAVRRTQALSARRTSAWERSPRCRSTHEMPPPGYTMLLKFRPKALFLSARKRSAQVDAVTPVELLLAVTRRE